MTPDPAPDLPPEALDALVHMLGEWSACDEEAQAAAATTALRARLAEVERLRQTGARVRIEGRCDSACTLYLGIHGACVTRAARLGFHGPRAASGLPLPYAEWDRLSQAMAATYPDPARGAAFCAAVNAA